MLYIIPNILHKFKLKIYIDARIRKTNLSTTMKRSLRIHFCSHCRGKLDSFGNHATLRGETIKATD